jgi:arginase family enzyme
MNFEDFIVAPQPIAVEPWQLGSLMGSEIQENTVVLVFVSDCRGAGYPAESQCFQGLRKKIYQLSKGDMRLKICDLGDFISGRNIQDSHYILQELLLTCHNKNAIPVVVGGSADFSFSLFSALNEEMKNINFTHISPSFSLTDDEEIITEENYLSKILQTKDFSIGQFNFLGIQRHFADAESMKILQEVNFEVVPLSTMMHSTEKTEPYFRKSHLATINCDAVESFGDAFSLHPQVNGLNRREVCAYMKEIGLSENLKSVGIFNYNIYETGILNEQLMAQMIWYLLDGISIQQSHPKEREFETFVVMMDAEMLVFKRDVFSGLWYFGDGEIEAAIPCTREDFDLAKNGFLNKRFLK